MRHFRRTAEIKRYVLYKFCVTTSPSLPEYITKMLKTASSLLLSLTNIHDLMSMLRNVCQMLEFVSTIKQYVSLFWYCHETAHKRRTLSCLQNYFISLESLSELWRTSLFNEAQGLMNPLCVIIGLLYKRRSFAYHRLSLTMSQINHKACKKKIMWLTHSYKIRTLCWIYIQ